MDRMQRALCAEVRPGADWRDIHLRAHALTAEVLREADLILCTPGEALQKRVTSVFLPHGIGHLLGLEVHDVGGFMASPEGGDIAKPEGHPYLRLTRRLEPGFVVTMEPGIYFIDQLLERARSDERAGLINWSRVGQLSLRGDPDRGRSRSARGPLREPHPGGIRGNRLRSLERNRGPGAPIESPAIRIRPFWREYL